MHSLPREQLPNAGLAAAQSQLEHPGRSSRRKRHCIEALVALSATTGIGALLYQPPANTSSRPAVSRPAPHTSLLGDSSPVVIARAEYLPQPQLPVGIPERPSHPVLDRGIMKTTLFSDQTGFFEYDAPRLLGEPAKIDSRIIAGKARCITPEDTTQPEGLNVTASNSFADRREPLNFFVSTPEAAAACRDNLNPSSINLFTGAIASILLPGGRLELLH